MSDDKGAFGNTGDDLGREIASAADFDLAQSCALVLDREDGPVVALPEKSASGDLQHVLSFPDHEGGVQPIAVAEIPPEGSFEFVQACRLVPAPRITLSAFKVWFAR